MILLSLLPLNAVWATTASISISGNEGLITLTASASFSTYVQCTPPGSTNCINVNSGTLYVYQNGTLMQRVSGPGSVNWSTTMDGGSMGQGEYTFTASAVDSVGESSSQTTSITIDNTPQVNVMSPGLVSGAFDILGSVRFKERVGGNEGTISIYLDAMPPALPEGWSNYEGTMLNWSYSQVVGRMLDGGSLAQGTHTIHVLARAANGASSWAHETFTIDNTPTVSVNSPGQVEGAFDLTGSIQISREGQRE